MFGGLNWTIVDVTREAITVDVYASGRAAIDAAASATRLRNCTLAFLRDIVVSDKFVVRLRSWDGKADVQEIALPYSGHDGPLENNVLLIEEVCEPKRAELRRAIELLAS